eukprot:TRINITY_DN3602_c0_g1_i2.p1 TRINITY_DN3602_c0_g1~~TRINITY_DN3602_c0_g1_i2.p1  ORF type:complete len:105 (-),score=16.90 TRINITY_DN3602_c0_g1_i2:92-406(-)
MKELLAEKNELLAKIARLERQAQDTGSVSGDGLVTEKRRRHRRCANEIDRSFRCPVEGCPKSYGLEGSLVQHIKLKHPKYYEANQITPSQVARTARQEAAPKAE